MLKEIVDKMRLNLPDSRIRTMFNLMDVNHDKSLDLAELLGGFELLFGKLIPDLLVEAVGVSTHHQIVVITTSLLGLIVFFMFIGLAFSSFVVRRYGNGIGLKKNHGNNNMTIILNKVCFHNL